MARSTRLGAAGAGQDCAGGAVRPEIIDAVDGQKIGETGAGAINPALDGADRTATNSGGFFVRESRRPDQDQGFALIGRKLRQRAAKFVELDPAGLLGM